MSSKFSQVLSVTRQAPELIVPARPRPRELKQLSDIDDQVRLLVPVIFFYKNSPSVKEKDPVSVIKEAISKALVFYYPFAGRLIEGPNRKLLVDCNGEGILFIEAEADFTLEQLGDEIQPPCPYFEQLLYNVPGSEAILGSPLLLIQVTRLACGGFILALRFNHTMCDGFGLSQFLKAIEEMVRGAKEPSMLPIWQRELLTRTHHEYDGIESTQGTVNPNDIAHKSFNFGSKEILALRNQLPIHLRNNCTNFELLTACIWKCRSTALELQPNEIVRVSCAVNLRSMKYNNQLPPGYYGNAIALPVVSSKAGLLSKYYSLGYAVELVKKLKDSKEYIRSLIDFRDIKENFFVSDFTRFGFKELDFGWGKPVFAGPAGAILFISCYIKFQSKDNGEYGTLVPICLPLKAMERFEEELKKITNYGPKL